MAAALTAFFRGWWVWLNFRTTPVPTPARRELWMEEKKRMTVEPLPVEAHVTEAVAVPGGEKPALAADPAGRPAAALPVRPAAVEVVTRAPFIPVAQPALRAGTLAKLAALQQIPSLHSLAQGFLRAASRADGSIEDVVAAVEKDPALCVRVLRMANSAAVSPEQRIEDVFTAVQMLGLQRVNTLTHALFMMRDARDRSGGVDWRHLWIHALATAAIAEEIEEQLGRPASHPLYLAALLHDVGKIVLSTIAPEAYRAIMDKVWVGEGRLDALEAACFGVGHGEAGVIFAQQCGLPAESISAMGHHAEPAAAEQHRLTVAVVSLANYLAKFYGLGFSGSRLDETDGDLDSQPGWVVIAEETGVTPDVARIALAVQGAIGVLKHELLSLREAA